MALNNPNAKANLKPFVKGEDSRRNKAGRPPKLPDLDTILADVLGEEKDGVTAGQAILMALRGKATKGDVRAAEVLLDRAYGKAKQEMKIEGEMNMNLPAINVYNNAPPLSSSEEEVI